MDNDKNKTGASVTLSETFFNMLEKKRVGLNLTQKEVAKQIGVTTRTYKAISNGSAKMATFIDAAVALGLNCTLVDSSIIPAPVEQNRHTEAKQQVLPTEPLNESIKSYGAGQDDWHPAHIISAVKLKTGMSLRQLSLRNNLAAGTVGQALLRAYPHAEKIIADALDIEPKMIWPSRYTEDGKSTRKRLRPAKK